MMNNKVKMIVKEADLQRTMRMVNRTWYSKYEDKWQVFESIAQAVQCKEIRNG